METDPETRGQGQKRDRTHIKKRARESREWIEELKHSYYLAP